MKKSFLLILSSLMLVGLFSINISENTKMLADSNSFTNSPSTGIWNAKNFPGGTAIWPYTGSKSSSTNTGGKIIVRQYGKGRYLNGYDYRCLEDGWCTCQQIKGAITPYGTIDDCVSKNPTKPPELTAPKKGGKVNKLSDSLHFYACYQDGRHIGWKHGWTIQCYKYFPCKCISLPGCQPFFTQEECQERLNSYQKR